MWPEIMQQVAETQKVHQGEVNLSGQQHENMKQNVVGLGMKSHSK